MVERLIAEDLLKKIKLKLKKTTIKDMPEPLEGSQDKSPHNSRSGGAITHPLILFYLSIIAY